MAPEGGLFESIFSSDELLAATSDAAWVAAMLRFETALALALAEVGVVPEDDADRIAECCAEADLDPVALGRSGRAGGNPVIPLVSRLRELVPGPAAGWVHFGATSQDALDTALMLIGRDVIALVIADLDRLAEGAADLAERHRSTPMAARTLLQQAGPTTFGLKAAGWLVAAVDAARGLRQAQDRCPAVQLGGATGTLAALGPAGERAVDALARRLGLPVPVIPWHTDRTRVADLAAAFGVAAGVAGKVAVDVSLLMQTEVAEVSEPTAPGRGGSSALPHKRNPALSAAVIADHRRAAALTGVVIGAMAQEHERSAGAWHAEWPTMTALFRSAGGAVRGAAEVVGGLEIDEAAMAVNLQRTGGMVTAERVTLELAGHIGYTEARAAVDAAAATSRRSGESLRDSLPAEARDLLAPDVFDPAGWTGSAAAFVDRALDYYRRYATVE